MGEEQRHAFAKLFAEDEAFKAALKGATSVEEAVRIAREHGVEVTSDDLKAPAGDLSDADLEMAAGGVWYDLASSYAWRHGIGCG